MPPINATEIVIFKDNLEDFITKASTDVLTNKPPTDVLTNKPPTYNVERMMERFESLKDFLRQSANNDKDFISLIITYNRGMNGWNDSNTLINQNKYVYDGLVKNENLTDDSLGAFSGKIAFRRELVEAAIEGGYLKNVKAENLFKESMPMAANLKIVIENCPKEVLALGQKNMLGLINKLSDHLFLSSEQKNQWVEDFKADVKPYAHNNAHNFMDKILSKITGMRDSATKNSSAPKP